MDDDAHSRHRAPRRAGVATARASDEDERQRGARVFFDDDMLAALPESSAPPSEPGVGVSLLFAAAQRPGAAPARAPTPAGGALLGPPQSIGRFAVLRVLGSGGMGVVLSAYDEELDRRVAIKLLRAKDREHGRDRMVREAQALARLSHPNVVQVYEVGDHEGHLYLAMEFVEGATLRGWLKEQKRSWREVVAMFRQIVEGLRAAHDAGLVHRDLKPDNVIVGVDGRARILDFGLARADASLAAPRPAETIPSGAAESPRDDPGSSSSRSGRGSSILNAELTDANTVLGTPAYMSPEQYVGDTVDARSDLFSLSIMLYEALYGRRPFSGDTLRALRQNILVGHADAPPADARVPSWVQRVVARGLLVDPVDRWQSAAQLARALARDPTRGRRRTLMLGALGAAIGGLGYGLATVNEPAGPPPCDAIGDAEIAEAWNDEARARVRLGLLATGARIAEDTWTRVAAPLDDYARRWRDERVAICEAHRAGARSDEAQLMQLACLAQRRASLDGLARVLAQADDAMLEQAAVATASLPALERCADLDALSSGVTPPADPATAAAVQRAREQLARARAAQDAGRWEEALALIEQLERGASALDYPPLMAELSLRRGDTLLMAMRGEQADDALSKALRLGLSSDHDEVAAHALIRRVFVYAELLNDPDRAERDVEFVEALAPRFAKDREFAWLRANNLGIYYFYRGDGERSAAMSRQAVTAGRDANGDETYRAAFSLFNLAEYYNDTGESARAGASYREVIAQLERLLGPAHPTTAQARLALALNLIERGELAQAPALIERVAVEFGETVRLHDARAKLAFATRIPAEYAAHARHAYESWRALDDPRQHAWRLHEGLGLALSGDEDAARARLAQSAQELAAAGALPAEPTVFTLLAETALRVELGDFAEAVARCDEADALARATVGPTQLMRISTALECAVTLARSPRPEDQARAPAALEQARVLLAEQLPPAHPKHAELAQAHGEWLLARGDAAAAAARFEHADALYVDTLPDDNPLRAHAHALLLRARVDAGAPLASARRELEAAIATLRERAPGFADWRREHEAWLRRRA